MTQKRFALVVENEVFEILIVDESFPFYQRWVDGFSGEHIGMDASDMENVEIGSIWDGNKFSLPEKE